MFIIFFFFKYARSLPRAHDRRAGWHGVETRCFPFGLLILRTRCREEKYRTIKSLRRCLGVHEIEARPGWPGKHIDGVAGNLPSVNYRIINIPPGFPSEIVIFCFAANAGRPRNASRTEPASRNLPGAPSHTARRGIPVARSTVQPAARPPAYCSASLNWITGCMLVKFGISAKISGPCCAAAAWNASSDAKDSSAMAR